METEGKTELLEEAVEMLKKLNDIYTELAETFLKKKDKKNAEFFLNECDNIIEQMLTIFKITSDSFKFDEAKIREEIEAKKKA